MTHIDPESLALLALGEDALADDDLAHLGACGACADELAALSEAALIGRESTRSVALEAPPAAVWDRIHAELGLGAEVSTPVEHVPASEPIAARPVLVEDDGAIGHEGVAAPVVALDPRRAARRPRAPRRRLPWAVGAAAAALVVGIAGGAWWQSSGSDGPVVARATLEAFPGWDGATGSAELEEGADGARELVVHVDAAAGADRYREVWLLAADASGLVGLGVLEGEDGRFTVPSGVDLTRFALVDVSAEPLDGDPAHSGDSIVRGELQQG